MPVSQEQLIKIYKSKNVALDSVRSEMIPTWTDIRNYLAPRTARFPGEKANSGARQDLNIINTAPRIAVRTLPAGMQSGVTSPMRPWFRLGTPDADLQEFGPVKEWLFMVERLMRDVFARSNVYDRLKACYSTLGNYGTAAIGIDEDKDDMIRASDFPIGSFKIITSASNRVHTMYRDVSMNCEQMIEKFADGDMKKAKDILPDVVMTNYDNGNYDFMYPLVHIMEPNRNFVINSALSKFKKYASVWFDSSRQGRESILGYAGYDDIPFMAPRWDVLGEDCFGTGCGEIALGDAKQLQLTEKRKLQGIDKNANPPKIADASMRNQRISSMPGDTTYVNGLITGRPGVQPMYQVNPYINEYKEEIAKISSRIDEAYYKNLFLMVTEMADQPNITATQINTMREEKLLMLGPVLERLNDELLDPLINRTFNLMFKNGMLPPPPKEIQGQPLRVEYISVLAQAQKAMGIGNIERFVGFVGNLAQMQAATGGRPDVLDKLNLDETIDAYGDGVAVPPKIIRGAEAVDEIRAAQAKMQQQQQALAMASAGAKTAKDLAGADMQGDNALTRASGGLEQLMGMGNA